jgi:hypothetical protein
VEAVEIEIFLSSQGSWIVNMKKSSTVYSFLVRAHNLKSSESSKEVNPGSIEAFCYASRCCCRKRQVLHTELARSFPHHDQSFRPLNLIVISVTTVRRHDVTPPTSSATVLTTPRPHELTLLSSVLSTWDIG